MAEYKIKPDNWIASSTRILLRYRWIVILSSLLISILLSIGMKNLSFSNDYRVLFPTDNPHLKNFEQFENQFTRDDVIMVGISNSKDSIYEEQTLKAIHELTKKLWTLPYSMRVDSLTNHLHTRVEGDDLLVEELLENPDEITPEQIRQIERNVDGDPSLRKRLVSEDKKISIISITLQLPQDPLREIPEAVEAAKKIRDEIKAKYPGVDVFLSGNAYLVVRLGCTTFS